MFVASTLLSCDFFQENGPAGAEEGKSASADADRSKDSGGSAGGGGSKSTAHFTPDELEGILQVKTTLIVA